jgi:AtzE family amidohydrolase
MTDFCSLTAAEIATGIAGGTFSAREIVDACLARIAVHNGTLNAFTTVTAERARKSADAIDAKRAAGKPLGPLAGVPFSVKNLFDIEGVATLAGAKINADNAPATRDATLITRLEAADAILIGAVTMGEYAYDFTGENAHFGASRNPHDPSRMSGGSSGGSGTAVAAGFGALSLGSDTNGSIRVPSSFCGLFGLKPTYGRLSRAHTFPFVGSIDHLGPLARSAADLALAYDAMQGADSDDPGQTPRAIEPTMPLLQNGVEGLRIATAGGYFAKGGDAVAFEAVAHVAKALGATRTIEISEAARGRAAAYLVTMAEGAALHLDRLRTRAADFDGDTRYRLLAGTMLPAAWVVRAQQFRRWYRDAALKLFDEVDIILAPSTPSVAPPLGTKTITLDGVEMPLRPNIGVFTQPISCIGLPVAAVPVWLKSSHLPIGVQVIAAPWREDLVLRVAHALEQAGIARAPVATLEKETA